MNIKKIPLLFFLLVHLSISHAQEEEYAIRHFTTDEGLSHNATSCIYQDSRNFIWIGTRYGLNRFDGHEFKVFTKKKNGLEQNRIHKIFEDLEGKLWINFLGQITTIFDVETEQAYSFDEAFPNAPFQLKDIQIIQGDKEKKIWIITKDGRLYVYDGEFNFIGVHKDFLNIDILKIINDNEIYTLNRSDKKLMRINGKGEIMNVVTIDNPYIVDIGKKSDDEFWVSSGVKGLSEEVLKVFDWKGNRRKVYFKNESNDNQELDKIIEGKDSEGNPQIWYIGKNAFYTFDKKTKTRTDIHTFLQNEIGQFIPYDIYVDGLKNMWITTNVGVVLLSPKNNLFTTFLTNKKIRGYKYSMRGLEELDRENIFVASYSGFFKINKRTKEETNLNVSWRDKSLHGVAYGVGTISIGDTILSGCHAPWFWIFDKNSLEDNELVKFDSLSLQFNAFFKDHFGQIWIGTNAGLLHLDLKNKKVSKPSHLDAKSKFSQAAVFHIVEHKDELLISTDLGLFSINHKGKILNQFDELNDYQINFLHQKSKQQYWLTTKGDGLILWNRATKELQRFNTEQGLSDNFIYSIHEDEFGYFWLPSNNGLMRFNPKDFSVNTFKESDGIADSEFNSFSNLVTKDGQIFLGGVNGLTTFHPKDFRFFEQPDIPFKVIGAQKLKEGETKLSEFEIKNGVNFNPSDKTINLDFCLFDYYNSFQSKYAYQIEGYHEKWNYLNDNKLTINRMPYGDYNLKVKAQGRNGIWVNQKLNIPLHVIKPFYLRWPFIILSMVAFAIAINRIIKWRIKNLEKKNIALENVVAERTKELANINQIKDQFFAIIAHDLRGHVISFKNTSKKVAFLKRKGKEHEIENYLQLIDNSADNLSNLLDNLLNWALVEKGIFPYHPEVINLKDIVEENIALFQPLSQVKEVDLQNKIPDDLNLFADKNAVLTILRNLFSNAIKYSESGDKIIVQAFKEKNRMLIQIKDTGVGIPAAKLKDIFELNSEKNEHGTMGEKGSGFGLSLCKRLIELNKGNIQIESEQGKGTMVMVEFPSKQSTLIKPTNNLF